LFHSDRSVCARAQRIRPCCAPHVAIKPPSSCSDNCLCAGCASPWASRPTAPRRRLLNETSKTCSLDKHPSSNTRLATRVATPNTSSSRSTRRVGAHRRFQFVPSFKTPTGSCTCDCAYTHTHLNPQPSTLNPQPATLTPPFSYPLPLPSPCPWPPRATTHTMCTRAPPRHRGFEPCRPQRRGCTLEARAS